jgi:hypothetical protein
VASGIASGQVFVSGTKVRRVKGRPLHLCAVDLPGIAGVRIAHSALRR